MRWTVGDIIEATQGRLMQGNFETNVTRICTDTRILGAGDCFVPLLGENFDGHRFLKDAFAKGAAAVLTDRADIGVVAPPGVAVIRVSNTLHSLGELARFHRARHAVQVVGITGSNGKTSTKEMIASVLSVNRRVHKNEGNLNNLIGVPLTILALEPEHEFAVIEMGINVPGEMDRLVEISEPNVGLITNIHPAHLEGLGSLDGILKEKGKLLECLPADGLAVINWDDERIRHFSKRLKAPTISYSLRSSEADVHFLETVARSEGTNTFAFRLGQKRATVQLSVIGEHHVENALAAAAVAFGMGESVDAIEEGLAAHRPVEQRMVTHRLADGTLLIDDTYNANPKSVIAAVRAAVEECGGRDVIAVLGDMKEMGAEGEALHYAVGVQIGGMGLAKLVTLGSLAAEIAKGAQQAGMPPQACYHAKDHEEIGHYLKRQWIPNACIVVKGSRAMEMERIVAQLRGGGG